MAKYHPGQLEQEKWKTHQERATDATNGMPSSSQILTKSISKEQFNKRNTLKTNAENWLYKLRLVLKASALSMVTITM